MSPIFVGSEVVCNSSYQKQISANIYSFIYIFIVLGVYSATILDTLTKGDFGPAKAEIIEKTGIQNYDVQMDTIFGKFPGVVNENGTQIDFWGFTNGPEVIKWLSEEELEKVKEGREPAEAPSISYFTPQPDSPGKLIWLSGIMILQSIH